MWMGRPLLIVEFLEGGTLADRVNGGPQAISDVVDWGLQLCAGLTCLHRRGLLHGDIKPSNIGFDRSGVPKLLDFGLSDVLAGEPAARDDAAGLAAGPVGERFGTPAYRCPHTEEFAARPQLDLWGLASILYESIAAVRVFDVAVPRTGSVAVVPDIRTFRLEVPEALAMFFSRALHSDVETRPASALEFSLWLNEARPIL
jgi:serine/threonine-protein kinase